MRKRWLLRGLSLYPPYLGAGIRVRRVSPDLRTIEVEMRLRFWNGNYVGTHFGGSLFSMCDPFYMLMLIENLGRGYVVWDKSAAIRFLRPGRGRVSARFHLSAERLEEIRAQADAQGRVEPEFVVEVRDEAGDLVAEVTKRISVRRRDAARTVVSPQAGGAPS
jgi:acyl-coenzyme A thioesterase PaaI-like protein